MHAIVSRTDLIRTLRWIQVYLKAHQIQRSIALPVKVNSDGLLFTIQIDEHNCLEISIPVEKPSTGSVRINTQKMLRFARSLPGEFLELHCNTPPRFELRSGSCCFHLACSEDEDKTSAPEESRTQVTTFTGKELHDTLKKLIPSMYKDSFRHGLNAMSIHQRKGRLALCTTDGHRLTLCTLEREELPSVPCNVPYRAIITIKSCARFHEQWTFSAGEQTIEIRSHRYRLVTSRNDNDSFPEYEDVIPSDDQIKVTATLDGRRLKSAMSRCITMDSSSYSAVARFTFGANQQLEITSGRQISIGENINDYYTEILDNTPCSERFILGMNCNYVADMLKVIDLKKPLEFRFKRPLSPISIKDGDDLFVLMPIRLD